MWDDTGLIAVQVTAGSETEAETLAQAALSAGLAACVQTHAIASRYTWKGKVEREAEIMVVMKTTREAFAALETLILDTHSYDEPEIIALPIVAASQGYAAWVRKSVTAGG